MLSFRSISPGVLHLCCVMSVVGRKRLVDDVDVEDDDMAMEVQTNFVHSQNFSSDDIRDSSSLLQ